MCLQIKKILNIPQKNQVSKFKILDSKIPKENLLLIVPLNSKLKDVKEILIKYPNLELIVQRVQRKIIESPHSKFITRKIPKKNLLLVEPPNSKFKDSKEKLISLKISKSLTKEKLLLIEPPNSNDLVSELRIQRFQRKIMEYQNLKFLIQRKSCC